MSSPLILVGLPRSGSTLLSRILNDSLNCFIINDFYYLQYVESIDGYTKFDQDTKGLLVDFIVNQVKNRTKSEDLEDEIWFGLPFSETDLKSVCDFAEAYKARDEIKKWSQILQDFMQFLAKLANKPIWGYNTPQDYLNFNVISEAFPEAQFIFLLRSPLATLLSYKYYWTVAPKFRKDRGRYHPVIQSLAWNTCVKTYFDLKEEHGQSRCMLVKFEEILNNTDKMLANISRFSGIEFPTIDLAAYGHNSSLAKDDKGRRPKRITGLEAKICYLLTQKTRHRLDYNGVSDQSVGLTDFIVLTIITFRNSVYYFRQILFSRNVRKRVFKFVNQMAS